MAAIEAKDLCSALKQVRVEVSEQEVEAYFVQQHYNGHLHAGFANQKTSDAGIIVHGLETTKLPDGKYGAKIVVVESHPFSTSWLEEIIAQRVLKETDAKPYELELNKDAFGMRKFRATVTEPDHLSEATSCITNLFVAYRQALGELADFAVNAVGEGK